MKKFLALLLALCMMLALVACGEDEGTENNNNNNNNAASGGSTATVGGFFGSLADADKFGMGFGIKDASALLKLFGGTVVAEGVDIKNFEMMGATDGVTGFASLSGTLFGEKHTANAFFNGINAVVTAPSLTDTALGVNLEELMSFLMVPTTPDQDGTAGSVAGILGTLADLDFEAVGALLERYGQTLLTELKTNAGLTVDGNETDFVIEGTLTADNLGTLLGNMVIYVMADEALWEIIEPIAGVTREEVAADMPEKELLIAGLQQMLQQAVTELSVRVSIHFKNSLPVMAGIYATVTPKSYDEPAETLEIDFSYNTDSEFGDKGMSLRLAVNECRLLDFTVTPNGLQLKGYDTDRQEQVLHLQIEQGTLSLSMDDGEETVDVNFTVNANGFTATYDDGANLYQADLIVNDKGANFTVTQNGQDLMAVSVTVGDDRITLKVNYAGQNIVATLKEGGSNITGSLKIGETELGSIVFGKKVTGSRLTLTLESITVQGQKLDLSAAGLSVFFDSNPTIPAMPAQYESLLDMDQDRLQALINGIAAEHPQLFQKLGALFGSAAESNKESDQDHDEYVSGSGTISDKLNDVANQLTGGKGDKVNINTTGTDTLTGIVGKKGTCSLCNAEKTDLVEITLGGYDGYVCKACAKEIQSLGNLVG